MRWDSRAGASPARSRIGRSHERISAMIDIQERALRAFKQNIVAAPHGVMEQHDGIRNKRLQVISSGPISLVNRLKRKRFCAESFEDLVVLFYFEFELLLEALGIDEVDDAQAGSGGLIAISGADATLGRADLVFAFENLALGVEFRVIRKNELSGLAEEQIDAAFDA